MKRVRRYFLPGLIAALLIAAAFLAGGRSSGSKSVAAASEEFIMPSGRVLYIVAEKEGAYLGEEFVPFPLFDQFIRDRSRVFGADYFIVLGTSEARYGDVATAFASVHRATNAPGTIVTKPVPVGTRRPVMAVREHFWQY